MKAAGGVAGSLFFNPQFNHETKIGKFMSTELIKSEKGLQVVTDNELVMHLENLGLLNKLSQGEKNTYLKIAKAFNLNPFKREIHVSKYGDQMSIITGYEVYIKRAERTGLLDGWDVKTEGNTNDGSLKATITIHRKDRSKPFVWEVLYKEYVQLKDGRPNKFWQKAETMTKKVAMSQGFRLCFSDELGGMPYTSEEMNDETMQDVPHEVVNTTMSISHPSPDQPTMTEEERQYRTSTNDVEVIYELIDKAGDPKLLRVFHSINNSFFKTNPEAEQRLIEKGKSLTQKVA